MKFMKLVVVQSNKILLNMQQDCEKNKFDHKYMHNKM